MKYLTKFTNHTQYEAYTASTVFMTPNVSYCEQEDEVHFNPSSEPPTPVIRAITYSASAQLNVDLTAFTPAATAETFADGVGKIEFSEPVTEIGYGAFNDKAALRSVVIPDGVTSIGQSAFVYCSGLTSIDIPDSVTSIGQGAFGWCSGLTSIDIPDSVTSIEAVTFSNCSGLQSIDIPDSVTSIGQGAFGWCSGLTSVTIGSGITSIGIYVFMGCSGLTSITCEAATPPTLEVGAFDGSTCPIYVPSGSVGAYQAAESWSSYKTRIQAIL